MDPGFRLELRFSVFIIRFLTIGLCSLVCLSCSESRRLPWVEPILHNWEMDYQGVEALRLHAFKTGTVNLPAVAVHRADDIRRWRSLSALVFAIEHPNRGLTLVGTGLSRQTSGAPERYFGAVRSSIFRVNMDAGQDILSQLEMAGLGHLPIEEIVMPDLSFLHAGGLEHFDDVPILIGATELAAASESTIFGFYRGDDFANISEWRFANFDEMDPLGTFAKSYDLLGDGSIWLIDVSGTSAGGLAVLVNLPDRPVLLAGNLCRTEDQMRFAWMPGLVADPGLWWRRIWRLKKFAELVPTLMVIPSHDWNVVERAASFSFSVHSHIEDGKQESQKEPGGS